MKKSKSSYFRIIIPVSLVIIVLLVKIGVTSSFNDVEREDFEIKKSKYSSWEEVFSNPQPIKIKTFKTGTMDCPMSGLINLNHENANEIEDEVVTVDVYSHLIKHKHFGNYLIDAGLSSYYQKNPYGNLKGELVTQYSAPGKQKKGQNIAAKLKKKKIILKGVFFTHLHIDHISGVLDLPKCIDYIAGKNEEYFNTKEFHGGYFDDVDFLYEIDCTRGTKMPILGDCVDVFGDGSLWAISTTGHSKGHLSFLINKKKRPVLILGDASLIKENVEYEVGPGFFSGNVEQAQSSLNKILTFINKYPKVKIIHGHDK